jgi:hypothetical protein
MRPLYMTPELFSCFFDLTTRQASSAMHTCDTSIKRMRMWASLDRWPCKEVRTETHPVHTIDSVRRVRRLHIEATRITQPEMFKALLRAEELSFNPREEGFPTALLAGMDEPDDTAESETAAPVAPVATPPPADAEAPGPRCEATEDPVATGAAWGTQEWGPVDDANLFEFSPEDPFWAEFC